MDYLVIGAGPGGLQLGWFLQQAGRDYLILEAGSTPGTFFHSFPRHRRMLSINQPHTGLRMDWSSLLSDDPNLLFTRYTGRYVPDADDYVRYLSDYASGHGLNIRYNTRAAHVGRDDSLQFVVTDQRGQVFRARRLIVATGVGRPYLPPIPGIETTERYGDVSVDPADFAGQRVLIIGKGNSAFETANNLVESAAVIHVAGPRAVRAVNTTFLDSCAPNAQNMVLDAAIQRIERMDREFVVTLSHTGRNRIDQVRYDRVITCTGFQLDSTIFDETCRPELAVNGRLPALTAEWESANVPDLYFAGTLTQVRDLKKSTSAFVHGFRYGAQALQRMLDGKYEAAEWPHRELPADADAMTEAVLARINRSSALFHQYGFLCDLIVVGPGGAPYEPRARYYEELPVDYVHDSYLGSADCYFTITLEYGEESHDRYLHPVIRCYRRWSLVCVQPLPEDIYHDWTGEAEYGEPLRAYFVRQMAFALA